jgi:hypothetical protein
VARPFTVKGGWAKGFTDEGFHMKSFSKWVIALGASVLLAGAASAANTLTTGTIKSVNADKREFVLTDSAGKDATFKLGDDAIINRGGTEGPGELRADDLVSVCHVKGGRTSTVHYVLVKEGDMKECKLVHGTFKSYNADRKEFTNTEMGGKEWTYPMGAATVRLNMRDSRIEDIKVGDDTLIIVCPVGDKMKLSALMVTRK